MATASLLPQMVITSAVQMLGSLSELLFDVVFLQNTSAAIWRKLFKNIFLLLAKSKMCIMIVSSIIAQNAFQISQVFKIISTNELNCG